MASDRSRSSGARRGEKSDNHTGSFLNTDKYQCTADFFRAFHVGAADSILGRAVPDVIAKFRTGMPHKFPVVETGIRLDAAVIRYDMMTGKALEIKPISTMYDPNTETNE